MSFRVFKNKPRLQPLLSILLFIAGLKLTWAASISVEAFTDTARLPLQNTELNGAALTVYDLAAPKHLEQELSARLHLPADAAGATAIAQPFIAAHQQELAQQMMLAYQSHIQAMNYGLSAYPALIFNGHAVIYGVTDIQEGLRLYQQWLDNQQP